jgi:predicted enzyme related to lactoylglutathione lyase
MSMTLRIEIFPNDLGPTVDFYTGVLNFDLVRDESAAEAAYVALERGDVKLGRLRGRITAQIVIIGGRPPVSSWCWRWTTWRPSWTGSEGGAGPSKKS